MTAYDDAMIYERLMNPCPPSSYGYNMAWKHLVDTKTCDPVVEIDKSLNPETKKYDLSYKLKNTLNIKNLQKGVIL